MGIVKKGEKYVGYYLLEVFLIGGNLTELRLYIQVLQRILVPRKGSLSHIDTFSKKLLAHTHFTVFTPFLEFLLFTPPHLNL